MSLSRPILISANSAWNVLHFRMGLVRALQRQGFSIIIAAPADGSEEKLLGQGLGFAPMTLSRSGMNPVSELTLLGQYARVMRTVRPQAFLGFTIKPNIYGSIAARTLGIPTINNISGLGTMFLGQGWQARFALRLYRFAMKRSATVFFQNPDDKRLFLDTGTVRPAQARLLPGSGIDLDHFSPSDADPQSLTYLFIGRLLRDKGVREFVEAARLVRTEVPQARFELLGAPDPGNRTSIEADDLSKWVKEGIVHHLGDSDDVRPHIKRAMTVVLPSYREGLPRVLLEASAMGRPLIAADVPGSRTIVVPGRNGLLCEARSARSLADAMLAMARLSPEERSAMGQAARGIVERDYSEEAVVKAYLEVLADIARAQGVSP